MVAGDNQSLCNPEASFADDNLRTLTLFLQNGIHSMSLFYCFQSTFVLRDLVEEFCCGICHVVVASFMGGSWGDGSIFLSFFFKFVLPVNGMVVNEPESECVPSLYTYNCHF